MKSHRSWICTSLVLASDDGDGDDASVAFYAHRSDGTYVVSQGNILIFDRVVSNLGNGYNKAHGSFTAFTSGFYVFTLFYQTYGSTRSNFAVMVNDVAVCAGDTDYSGDQGGCTAVVQLGPGDVVNVKSLANRGSSSATLGQYGNCHGFTGYLYKAL